MYADSGYRGAHKRVGRDDLQWHIAARPSDIAKMPAGRAKARVQKHEHRKASVRAKVEHPIRVIKRQFGLAKVRFRGLQKKARTAPISTRTRRLRCGSTFQMRPNREMRLRPSLTKEDKI